MRITTIICQIWRSTTVTLGMISAFQMPITKIDSKCKGKLRHMKQNVRLSTSCTITGLTQSVS